jgi:hypothetical protein
MRQLGAWESSERTFSRFRYALDLLQYVDTDPADAIMAATRPNGSVNYSKLQRLADQALMRYLCDESGGPR